eukprot:scaffold117529_cov19-Tisochrysis_lutea.AAC.1
MILPGLIQPELLADGQVKVDMGEPILEGAKIPTTLAPTQGSSVIEQVRACPFELQVDGHSIRVTCVSMGNPHAITYSIDGKPIKVKSCVPLVRLHLELLTMLQHAQGRSPLHQMPGLLYPTLSMLHAVLAAPPG